VSPDEIWRTFKEIVDFSSEIFSTIAQLNFIFHLSRSDYGGPIFGVLCISQPLLTFINSRNLWQQGWMNHIDHCIHIDRVVFPAYLMFSNNVHYLRMRAMNELSKETYRHDIISGNLAAYVTEGKY
jgi:hypothetical protein